MKKKDFFYGILALLMISLLSVGFTACKNDDDPVEPKVTITNNSTYTLSRFRVIFLNSRLEELTDKEYGTFEPGSTVEAVIPTSAEEFYMATNINSKWFFSPNYKISYNKLNLSTGEIGKWSSNSSSSRYPKAASAE